MPSVEKLHIFLASPSDVGPERRHAQQVIEEINDTVADGHGVMLQLVRWERHTFPGYGADAQALVNAQITTMQEYELFVGIMWNRVGTKTPRAESGTIEEFERAAQAFKRAGRPTIWFYFRTAPAHLTTVEQVDQRKRVIAFKRRVQRNGFCCGGVGTYTGAPQKWSKRGNS